MYCLNKNEDRGRRHAVPGVVVVHGCVVVVVVIAILQYGHIVVHGRGPVCFVHVYWYHLQV